MIHENIKKGITDSLRAKDSLRLEVLRGLNALCINELIASGSSEPFITDEKVLSLVKKSAKQRKDSIEQFEKGGRSDLVAKEKAELDILNEFLPSLMTRPEITIIAKQRIDALKANGSFDPKSGGKITGMIMKELAGKADGSDVKAVVEEIMNG